MQDKKKKLTIEQIKNLARATKTVTQRKSKIRIHPIGKTWQVYINHPVTEPVDTNYDSDTTISFDCSRYRRRNQELRDKYSQRITLKLDIANWPNLHSANNIQSPVP